MRTETTPAATAVWLESTSAVWGWDSGLGGRGAATGGKRDLEPQLLSALIWNSDKHSQTPTKFKETVNVFLK